MRPFHAVAQAARMRPGAEIRVCTPSGNFGNLTAGMMAKRAGLPVSRFVAATNVNDVVPEYLERGIFSPRAAYLSRWRRPCLPGEMYRPMLFESWTMPR